MCSKDKGYWKTKNFILVAVFLIAIACEIIACVLLYNNYKITEKNNIEDNIKLITDNIRFQTYKFIDIIKYNLLRSGSLFRMNETNGVYVTPEQYRDNLQFKDSILTGKVESIFWTPKIYYDNKDNFQNFCREHIFMNCTIMEFNITSRMYIPVLPRPYYYPIILTEPPLSTGNLLLGYDLYTLTTKIFIDTALTSTNATGSFKIGLSNRLKNPNNYGILINQLVFINDSNISVENITGILFALISVNDIITGALEGTNQDLNRSDIDITVFDITNDSVASNRTYNRSLLYKEIDPKYVNVWFPEDYILEKNTVKLNFEITDRTWIVYFKFHDEYISHSVSSNKYIIVYTLAGVLFLLDIIGIMICKMYLTIKENVILEREKRVVASKMLNYVNHEIRNPLNVIDGMIDNVIDYIKRKEDQSGHIMFSDEEVKNVLSDMQTAYGSCESMRHIVNDILDIRKLEEGKMKIEYSDIELLPMVKFIHRSIIPKLREKYDVKFELEMMDNLNNSIIHSDRNRLQQILLNLIHNAIKFTFTGHITLRISINKDDDVVQLKPDNETKINIQNTVDIKFEVEDTGRGIPLLVQHKIFQPFQQTEAEDASRYGGVGLGLYLCRMMIQLLDGEISFKSQEGKGTTFWITFPTKVKFMSSNVQKTDKQNSIIELMPTQNNIKIESRDQNSLPTVTI
jgi:signal transduction histidine kinase